MIEEKEKISVQQVVVFRLDDLMYALPLANTVRVIHAVYITPLPDSPKVIMGLINLEGKILPVFDIRQRFALPIREIMPEDHFIIVQTKNRTVAIVADEVEGIRNLEKKDLVTKDHLTSKSAYVAGIVKTAAGMILIHDPDLFLSDEENRELSKAVLEMKKDL